MIFKYKYPKNSNVSLLSKQIRESDIVISLSHVDCINRLNETEIFFRQELSAQDKALLDELIEAHEDIEEAIPIFVETRKQAGDENIPYVYSTSRPLGHITYFTGEGDVPSTKTGGAEQRGGGDKMLFDMKSTDTEKCVDLIFNDDVYVKDGYVITDNAPFGSSMDIVILYPDGNIVDYFGKGIHLFGNYPMPMNTEDRAFIPKGLKIRVIVRNSSDNPSNFKVAGRLEMFRRKM